MQRITALIWILGAGAPALALEPASVFLLANKNMPASQEAAEHYCAKRGVPISRNGGNGAVHFFMVCARKSLTVCACAPDHMDLAPLVAGYLEKVGARLGPRDAVCVLTHDAKFDVPAIIGALETNVGYLGARIGFGRDPVRWAMTSSTRCASLWPRA